MRRQMVVGLEKHMRQETKHKEEEFFAFDDYNRVNEVTVTRFAKRVTVTYKQWRHNEVSSSWQDGYSGK